MTEVKPTGGSAFPEPVNKDGFSWRGGAQPATGMTLRDYFAAKALVEFGTWVSIDEPLTFDVVARKCYDMADAMIVARAK